MRNTSSICVFPDLADTLSCLSWCPYWALRSTCAYDEPGHGELCDLGHSWRRGSRLSCADLQAPIPEADASSHSDQVILEVLMQRSYSLAATAALALLMSTPFALAQTAPAAGGTAAPAAATTAAPAATTTTPSAATDNSSQPSDAKKSASKKPAKKKMTRQQEIDHSVDSGTVPARYRSSVPKQYQQYVPFEKQ